MIGGVPAPMLGLGAEKIKSASVLRVGKAAPLSASDVQVSRGQPFSELFLVFPRSGQAITLEDKEVEVVTALGSTQVKRKFKLKDMVFDGKLDL